MSSVHVRPFFRLFICLLLCSFAVSCGKIKKDPKFTAAIVNGKAITRTAFDNEMERVKQRFQNKAPKDESQLANIRMEILDILIGGELLYQASVKEKIVVSKAEIAKEMDKVHEIYPETETFKNTFTEDDISRKLAIEKYITKVFSDPTVISDEEARDYYTKNLDDFTKPEQVMASHILIKVPMDKSDEDTQKALKTIQMIQGKLAAGEEFAELAKAYSEDETSAKNGGALGYFMRGQMVASFEKAAFTAEKGQITDVVKTEFGFHLIKVLDKTPMVVIPYEDIAVKLKAYLKQQKVQKKVDSFIKEQRKNASIEIILT